MNSKQNVYLIQNIIARIFVVWDWYNKNLIKQKMLQKVFLLGFILAFLFPIQVLNWCKDATFKTLASINTMALSPSGRYLAVAHTDKVVRFFHGLRYTKITQYNVGFVVNVMRFSNDGSYLAIGGASNNIIVLNGFEPFSLNRTMGAFGTSVTATNVVGVDFSSDSSKFITCGSASGGQRLTMFSVSPTLPWSLINGSPLGLTPASNPTVDCRMSLFNDQVGVSTTGKLTIMSSNLGTNISSSTASTNFGRIVFDPIATQLVYIDVVGSKLMNYATVLGTAQQLVNPGLLSVSDFMLNGNYIAVGGSGKVLYIYNRSLLSAYQKWPTNGSIQGVAFNRDSAYPRLYVGDSTGQVLVLTFSCLSGECPVSYFRTSTGCQFCGDSITLCISCMNSSICDKCVDGYYVNPYTYKCIVCPMVGCLTCSSQLNCTECQSGFFLNSIGKCQRCSEMAVLEGCEVCDSSTTCVFCTNDYYLLVPNTSSVCKPCSTISKCLKCSDNITCTECITGYFSNSGVCNACDINCLMCTNSSANCSQCVKGYYVDKPTSYTCQLCPSQCLSCINSTFCIECKNGMYLQSNGSCSLCTSPCVSCLDATNCYFCADGYYLSGTTCLPCVNNCGSCNSSSYCVSCLAGYYLSAGTCMVCSGTYPNCAYCSSTACSYCQLGYTLNSSIKCQHCSLVMFKCDICNSTSNCLSCSPGFYLTATNAGNSSCKYCGTGCQTCNSSTICTKCLPNYYLDGSNKCIFCTGNCLQCIDSSTCLVCDNGYYLDSTTCKLCITNLSNCIDCLNGSVCVDCAEGYYLDGSDNKCHKCVSNCLTCNVSDCFSCNIGYFITTVSPKTCSPCSEACTQCTSLVSCTGCKAGFYLDSTLHICKNCSYNRFCQTCNNITCYSCLRGYYLDNTIAPPNYNCTRCISKIQGCFQCNASNYCLSCDKGYYLDSNNLCKPCSIINGCQQCSDPNTCTSCGLGFYLNTLNKCIVCQAGCSSCDQSGTCFTCYSGYYKSGSDCLGCETNIQGCAICSSSSNCLHCLNGYYLSTVTFKCQLCRSALVGCLYCNDTLTCTNCQPGFFLDTTNNLCQTCNNAMAGCQICASNSVCLDCEVGYYLQSGAGCVFCSSTLPGCISCVNMSFCEICTTGFYLGLDNQCHTCFSQNNGCEVCDAVSGSFSCLKCSSGYYMDSVTTLCKPCGTVGCKVCDYLNSANCITCDSLYYLSGISCLKCGSSIQGCSQCTNNTDCLTCDVGYYLDTNNQCQLCQNILDGCSKCQPVGTNFECQHCKSSYVLDMTTKTCKTCFSVILGCNYCVNETLCVSCANGYFKDDTTNMCRSCTEQPGCLLCKNGTNCDYCSPSYFMDNTVDKCKKCSSVITNCLTCVEPTKCLSCQSGYFVNGNFQCSQVTVAATQKTKEVKMFTEYMDSDTLGHTLYVKNGQYENTGYNMTGKCELYLTDYNKLTSSQEIVQIKLQIKDIKWLSKNEIKFITNNPTSLSQDSMGSAIHSRQIRQVSTFTNEQSAPHRILTASNVGNFKVSLQMSQQAVNTILPNIYQTGNLILDYSLSDPEFELSYMKYRGSSSSSYSLFGYIVTGVLIVNFIYKGYRMGASCQQKHHYLGQIIGHVLALKSIALFTYPISYELYYFCYGFMAVDIPWLNYSIGPLLAQRSDYVPIQYVMYYYNLNIASTYLLSLIVFIILLSCRFIISSDHQFGRFKYTTFIYCIFIFGIVFAGSLSFQGAIFNPIQSLTINAIFYLLGIFVLIGVLIEMIYSINKNKNQMYKMRIFIKSLLLSIGHLNPIIVVSVAVIMDVLLIIVQYIILEKTLPWSKFWFVNHLILDISLAIMFLLPNSTISLYSTIALVTIVVLIEIILNLKLMAYLISKSSNLKSVDDIPISQIKKSNAGNNDSTLQLFTQQKELDKYNTWNTQPATFNSSHDINIQNPRLHQHKKEFNSIKANYNLKNYNTIPLQNPRQQQGRMSRLRANRPYKQSNTTQLLTNHKKPSSLFKLQISNSSSPAQQSINSNEENEKKKVKPNFIRTFNNTSLKEKKKIIPFQ